METSSLQESEQQQQQRQINPTSQQQQQFQEQYPQQYQDYSYYYQQPYDPSYYYSYYQQQQYPQWPQYDPLHQNYAYYQQQQQQPPPVYYQPDSVPPQISDSGGAHQLQQSAYPPPPQPQPPAPVSVSSAAVPPASGLNPAAAAAIAALEQLTQFAGTMDAAERAMGGLPPAVNTPGFAHVSVRASDGQHPYRGGGRRGGGQFRGGRRGSIVQNHVSAPPLRGRGRGRGKARSRHLQPHVKSTSSRAESSAANEHTAGEAGQSAPAPETVAPKHRPAQIAWCELCRVDCSSLEILEQHKNGKRHKKNLLRIEEMKNAVKPGEEIQNDQERITSKPEESQEPQFAQDIEEQKSMENVPSEVPSNEPGTENNLQDNTMEKPEVPGESSSVQQGKRPKKNLFDARRRGMKRKMKGGRGGKRMKTYESHRLPVEPPKPKVVIPLICDLCNIKCDTREVLERHRAGKKHIAKLKRFEGHQAIYGPTGLQALYPPNPVTQTGHQPFYSSQASFPPQFPFQAYQSTAAVGASLDPQFSQNSMPQQSEATSTANPAAAAVLRL